MTPRATLQEVAELAGVSRGTASRALAGRGRVAESTRRRVREAAESLSFAPNAVASNFRRARTGTVGLWLPPDLRFMDYYMHFTFGVSEALADREVSLSLIAGSLRPQDVGRLAVDGFVMSDVVAGDPLALAILESGRPVVTSEIVPDGMPSPAASVVTDHAGAMRVALDRLRAGGARSIVVLIPEIEQSWVAAARAGADAWARAAPMDVAFTMLSEMPVAADLHAIVARTLQATPDVDAIVCAADGIAIGVLTALHDLGRAVPDDVQLVSHVDSAAMPVVLPPIAATDLRPRDAGAAAGRLLLDALDALDDERPAGRPHPVVETLELRFHPRASVRAGDAGRR